MGKRSLGVGTDDRSGSARGKTLWGLFCAGIGLFIVLISVNIIPTADTSFSAPRWIALSAGLAILLAGAAPGSVVANPLLGGAASMILVVIVNWVAFGPDKRGFSEGFALPFIAANGPDARPSASAP